MVDEWDGVPDLPAHSGWCWVEDADGLRPLLWRGTDWPEPADRGEWQDGAAILAAADLAGSIFHGRVTLSPPVAARFAALHGPRAKRHVGWRAFPLLRGMIASKPF